MLWNCNGEIKEITFEYNRRIHVYECWIDGWHYTCEKGWINAGPWAWLREGYTHEWAKGVNT